MNETEIESLIKQLKAAGLDEEEIMETFFETFQEGKMDRKDLETLAEFMGYELTDEFKNDKTPDPIAVKGISKEEAEDVKEIQPEEDKEEFKEKVESAKSEEEPVESEDEDKEWEEVQKKFKW